MTTYEAWCDRARAMKIAEVCDRLGIPINNSKSTYHRATCSCGSKSLVINTAKDRFICDGCGSSGGGITLTMNLKGWDHRNKDDFHAAVEWLTGERKPEKEKRPQPERLKTAIHRPLERDLGGASQIAGTPQAKQAEAAAGGEDFVPTASPPSDPKVDLWSGIIPVNWWDHLNDTQKDAVQRAAKLWKNAKPIWGTPAEQYLKEHRGLKDLPEDLSPRVLRFHHNVWIDGSGGRPALLARWSRIDGDQGCGVHRIILDHTGRRPLELTDGHKLFLGYNHGAAIKLSRDEDVTYGLCIGEGLETSIAAMIYKGFTPMWAMGSAWGISKLPVLGGVETLRILIDNDEGGAGLRAAEECGQRWVDAGREVSFASPRSERPSTIW